ncbi:MAG: alpha/beta fold hydrolase [Alphaproteobacteria bacterium]
MPTTNVRGVEIAYETTGNPADPALLIIMGLGSQLVHWPDELVDGLAARGYFVIRPDNRDVGLSQKFTDKGVPDLPQLMMDMAAGKNPEGPYTVSDMAADAVGVLDALGIDKAHIMGVSMGGMIVQHIAAEFPDRVKTLIPIMTTTGAPGLSAATPEAMGALLTPATSSAREDVLARNREVRHIIGSPGYPSDNARIDDYAGRAYDRCYHPEGQARQMAAVVSSGPRHELIAGIKTPTLVIHGVDDPLVPVDGGRDIAARIEGAEIVEIEGYGHDLPLELTDRFVALICDFADKVEGRTAQAAE